MHDRFIIIDYGEEDETFYHCGASSKDAGKAVTVISEMDGKISKESMRMVINMLMKNTELRLK